MLVKNKIGQSEIKSILIHESRVEVRMVDGTERHYYTNDAYDPNDELSMFHTRVRDKFLDGRDRHKAQGSKQYKADTIWELQGELLDMAGYGSVMYGYLNRLKSSAKEVFNRIYTIERKSTEENGIINFSISAEEWDNLVSDLESICGRK